MGLSHQRIEKLIERLKENDPTLTSLDLRNIDGSKSYAFLSGSAVFTEFIEALQRNHTVTDVNLILRFLTNLSHVEKLALFEAVGGLPRLDHLRFGASGLAGPALQLVNAALKKAKGTIHALTLQSIHFKGKIHYKSASASAFNTKDPEYIEFLDILRTDHRQSLESFTLQDVEDSFDLDPLSQLLATFPNLKALTLQSHSQFNQRLSQTSVERLFNSTSLRELALKRLRLVLVLPELLVSLEDNKTLESLSLEQNGINQEGGMAVAYLLGTNRTLKEISLAHNSIPDDCGSAIAGAVSRNTVLTKLDLSSNDLDLYTCRRFAHMLVGNESALEDLALGQNALRDEGVAMIAGGLGHNRTLKSLNLAESQITEASCAVLAATLHTNETLQRLNLADNKVRDPGCVALASALKENHTLTSLNLFGNQLKDDGVLALNETLKVNNSLDRVNLGNNPDLSPITYKALQDTLMVTNTSLEHLWLPVTIHIVMPDSCIPSYLFLNKLGRRQLLEELDNAELWADAMKAASDDIHCLYYLVRANPTVVSWLPNTSLINSS